MSDHGYRVDLRAAVDRASGRMVMVNRRDLERLLAEAAPRVLDLDAINAKIEAAIEPGASLDGLIGRLDAAVNLGQLGAEREPIEDLVERSSLGTPAARRARARVPQATADAILARVRGMGVELADTDDDAERLAVAAWDSSSDRVGIHGRHHEQTAHRRDELRRAARDTIRHLLQPAHRQEIR